MIPERPTAEELRAAGWRIEADDGFLGLVGPPWMKEDEQSVSYGILTERRHSNRRGVVQGGMLATLADRGLGRTARHRRPDQKQATVQLDIHYIDAVSVGEFVRSRCQVDRRTRTLIFVSGRLEVGERLVATMMGVFKLLGEPKEESE